ncbi:MAG: nitrogenase iron-molybdenum cofactor biosynthesis protein NifN [Pseudomonadales bacterium]|nr:nitrogenase iron-molybdenum cofactor biosynthesis protein NifN [Pseudomonadales bacterium]
MAEIKKRQKAMSVSPLKASQTIGAALAFLGFSRGMPLMHGSQGCTAFGKVFFVRHFREPIPLQTTAMDQVSSVMGADDNVVEALRVICEKNNPAIIGVVTTGLAETQGCNIQLALREFRDKYPQYENNAVVVVNTPDFSGCFESGFALALKGVIEQLIPRKEHAHQSASGQGSTTRKRAGLRRKQVNVICHGNLTPGDLEFISESITSFGLRPVLIPNLSGSLDGHLDEERYTPLTTGGLALDELDSIQESALTLSIGDSVRGVAAELYNRTEIPFHHFSHLMSLDAIDRWFHTLAELSGETVPQKWQNHRAQLQDAMLDTHFMIGTVRVGIAADPDLLIGFTGLLASMGAEVVAAVVPAKSKSIEKLPIETICIGDLEDLENEGRRTNVQLVIGNSHACDTAGRLGVPILRAGFPQYDYLGGFQRCWSGYRAVQQALFDIANMMLTQHQDIAAYHSIYSQKQAEQEQCWGVSDDNPEDDHARSQAGGYL